MSLEAAMELMHRVEDEYPVHEWRLSGMHIWPLIRFDIAGMLRHGPKPPQGTQPAGHGGPLRRLTKALGHESAAHRKDGAHNAPLTPCDVLFLGYSSYREQLDGVYYDRLLDPVRGAVETAGQRCLVLEQAPGSEFRTPRARPSHFIHRQLVWRNIMARLGRKADPSDITGLAGLLAELHEREAPLKRLTLERLAHRIAVISSYAAYFTAIIRRTRPRWLATAWYYGSEGLALSLAAHRAGLPITDIQHGVQGLHHFAYAPFQRIPTGGYDVLPQRFWCWTPEDAAQINGWGGGEHTAYYGGHPWASYLAHSSDPAVAEARSAVDAAFQQARGQRHILISLQWNDRDPFALLPLIADSPPEYRWWVRLHPALTGDRAELYARWEREGAGRVVARAASEQPLPLLLPRMDAHVTRTSSVIKEAAAYGVPSVAYDPAAATYYAIEHAAGSLHMANAQEDITSMLAALFAASTPRDARANPLVADLSQVVADEFTVSRS